MNWIKEVDAARSVEAVLDVVNNYLAERPDEFWFGIPERMQPATVGSEDQLHRWHHDLVQELTRAKSPNIHLQDVCVFSLRASVRIHQINLKEPGRTSNDREFSAAAHRSLS